MSRWGTKFLIITIRNGQVWWISKAATMRGAEASKRNSMKYTQFYPDTVVKILSVEEILRWDDAGLAELEALAKL